MEPHISKMIEAARQLLKAAGYFVDNLWHVDDVHFICEQQSLPRISNDEAMQVFDIANRQFDGESGICWPQLESALQVYLQTVRMLNDIGNGCKNS